MQVRFWGTRGSFPAMGPAFVRYGGDTACVAAQCGARTLVFDAGSGLRRMGASIPGPAQIDLFLSHLHLDHVMGLSHFAPIWRADSEIVIWLERDVADHARAHIMRLCGPPFHPVPFSEIPARIEWRTYELGAPFRPCPGIEVVAAPLPHPGGSNGFRANHDGASLVYGADAGKLSGAQRDLCRAWAHGADLVILDATFTCTEVETRRHWGHMSWREAADFGLEAEARQVMLFHHGPDRTDDELDQIAQAAGTLSPHVALARDGLNVNVQR